MFDIAIIGGGPAGYVTGIKAGQLGKKVICLDGSPKLGGTCLNVGCIPSKALLEVTHKFSLIPELEKYGLKVENPSFSLEKMMQYKEGVLNQLDQGIKGLFKKNKVEYRRGFASFLDKNTLNLQLEDGTSEKIQAEKIIIATGSQPNSLPGINIDEDFIISSNAALSLSQVPKNLAVIGAGVIGLEMSSIWARLGSKVTIIEYGSTILGGCDQDLSQEVQKILTKQGLNFIMEAQVTSIRDDIISYKKGDEECHLSGLDKVLVAVGRKPNTSGLNLGVIGLESQPNGQLEVDENYQTKVPGIFAIGDVIAGPMLAHKASDEGITLLERMQGVKSKVDYNLIPNIIYTYPEVAIIGKSEMELKRDNIAYKVGKFNFTGNSRAKALGDTSGFVKILINNQEEIIGAAIVNALAGEMIHEIAVAMGFRASAEDIARISHGHPTLSEAIREAMMAAYDRPIHS